MFVDYKLETTLKTNRLTTCYKNLDTFTTYWTLFLKYSPHCSIAFNEDPFQYYPHTGTYIFNKVLPRLLPTKILRKFVFPKMRCRMPLLSHPS